MVAGRCSEMNVLGAWPNPAKLASLMTVPPPPAGAPAGGPPPGGAPPPTTSAQLAPGVFQIKGAYNSLAVEFADYVVLVRAGSAERSSRAGRHRRDEEAVPRQAHPLWRDHAPSLRPHGRHCSRRGGGHHHRHARSEQGLPGKCVVGHARARARCVGEIRQEAVVEGFKGDTRVFQDATRTLEIHVVKGLPHADGLVVAWLPKEKILVYADMFNLPPAGNPVPNPPVIGTQVFLANIERLKLDRPHPVGPFAESGQAHVCGGYQGVSREEITVLVRGQSPTDQSKHDSHIMASAQRQCLPMPSNLERQRRHAFPDPGTGDAFAFLRGERMTRKKPSPPKTTDEPAKTRTAMPGLKQAPARTRARKSPSLAAPAVDPTVTDEEIARRAYALWESKGRPVGSQDEDWYRAKEELLAGR